MFDLFINIITLGLKPLYDRHLEFYEIIKEFRDKLPRAQNQARSLTTEEIENNPFLPDSFKHINAIDTSNHKTTISEADIDQFYNRINDFNYNGIIFKKHYREFTRNLNRFNPKAENKNFDLVVMQAVLKDDPFHPLKPLDVLKFHLKWRIRSTSKIYVRLRHGKDKHRRT